MATKKQKRAAALAKRETFMNEIKTEGLKALELDRARRTVYLDAMKRKVEEINDRHAAILARHGIVR
jgi:hypothetical protein